MAEQNTPPPSDQTPPHDPETGEVYEDDDAEEVNLVPMNTSSLATITNAEVIAQLDAAHRYPRNLKRFKRDTLEIAISTREVAESCMYSFKRAGKHIVGPSVRLAEIVAGTWQNMHAGARPMEVRATDVVSQGVAWDLQRNLRITVESVRRITNSDGERYNEDMIAMTQNAANSIALRNAIFRVVPRALISPLFELIMNTAIGEAKTLGTRRDEQMAYLMKMGADEASVLAALGKQSLDEIGLDEIGVLIGYGQAIHEGTKRVDELFPDVSKPGPMPGGANAQQGRRMSLGKPKPNASNASPAATTSNPTPKTSGGPGSGQQPLPTAAKTPAATPPAAGAGAGPPADDEDARARAAAAPTAAELAEMEKAKGGKS